MSVTRIRPDGLDTTYHHDVTHTTGESDPQSALSDASDSSYVRKDKSDGGNPMLVLTLDDYSLASGSDLVAVRPGARFKRPSTTSVASLGLGVALAPRLGDPYLAIFGKEALPYCTTAQETVLGWMEALLPSPLEITQDKVDALLLALFDACTSGDSNRATIYEAFVDVYALPRPTTSITCDNGSTVTATSFPRFSVVVSKVVESWQDGRYTDGDVWVRVFSAAQYGAGGFDPLTSAATYEGGLGSHGTMAYIDGSTPSTATAVVGTGPLDKSGTFRAYAFARHRATGAVWGESSYVQFTMNVTPLDAPTFTAVADTDGVTLEITSAGETGHDDNPVMFIQRSVNSGSTWETIRHCDGATASYVLDDGSTINPTAAFGVAKTWVDREAPRGVALSYRCALVSTLTASGERMQSDWVTDTATAIAASGWNLKAPFSPSLDIIGVNVLETPSYTQQEDITVLRPIGRTRAVVVSGAIGGTDVSLSLRASGTSEWTALEAIRQYQGTLYLESPFGWARYLRVVERGWDETGTPSVPRHVLNLSLVEVDEP